METHDAVVKSIREQIDTLKGAAEHHEREAQSCRASLSELRALLDDRPVADAKPPRRKRTKREPGLPDPDPREPQASDTVQR